MKLEITEEDHRRIDEAVAEHDPTGWLMSNRIGFFRRRMRSSMRTTTGPSCGHLLWPPSWLRRLKTRSPSWAGLSTIHSTT
jgi:hypothetical protein